MSRKMKPPQEVKIINSMPRIVRENFTVRFCKANEAPMWMQDGAVFDESGNEMEKIPDWLWEEYGKLTDDAKAKLKMTPPASGKYAGK